MALHHHGDHEREIEDPLHVARNMRLGLLLFALYLAYYTGFVLLNAFGRPVMERVHWLGINLAVWYGFSLIGAALLLALIYAWMCRPASPREEQA